MSGGGYEDLDRELMSPYPETPYRGLNVTVESVEEGPTNLIQLTQDKLEWLTFSLATTVENNPGETVPRQLLEEVNFIIQHVMDWHPVRGNFGVGGPVELNRREGYKDNPAHAFIQVEVCQADDPED